MLGVHCTESNFYTEQKIEPGHNIINNPKPVEGADKGLVLT